MPEPFMPKIRRRKSVSKSVSRRCSAAMVAGEVVEVVTTIGPQKHLLGVKILHGKANGIKLHRNKIITCKLSYRDKVLHNIGR